MPGIWFVIAGAVALNVYALVLVLLRAPVYRTRLYRPMILNIGLSIAPIVALIATILGMVAVVTTDASTAVFWIVLVLGGGIWLVLLPNAAYLITELNFSHRAEDDPTPLWYDIVLTVTLALSGIMNALLNVALAQTLYSLIRYPNSEAPLAHTSSWVVAAVIIVLVTVGIYLGRYIRFNTWDLLRPIRFARILVKHFSEPGSVTTLIGFVLVHSILLACLYLFLIAPIASTLA